MKYRLKIKRKDNREKVLENYGDLIWEWLCNEIHTGKIFKVSDTAKACPILNHLTLTTKRSYLALVLANVLAEYEKNPEMCPIKKISSQAYLMREDVKY